MLWQLFHYVPLNTDTKLSETRTLQFQWVAHQEANRRVLAKACAFASNPDLLIRPATFKCACYVQTEYMVSVRTEARTWHYQHSLAKHTTVQDSGDPILGLGLAIALICHTSIGVGG